MKMWGWKQAWGNERVSAFNDELGTAKTNELRALRSGILRKKRDEWKRFPEHGELLLLLFL
jgi:hypothetical protein